MASPSPPSSPRHSDFDPDVNDSQYWRNPTPPRQPQREHISFYDLLEGHERYGDVLVEGESESPPSVVPPPAAHAHQPAPVTTGEEMPDAVDDEPAIVTASRDAKTVQTEADILDSLRKIAVAPPPYAFPAVSFTPVWPDLNKYTSMDGATPPDPDFWAIPEHLDQGRHEVAMKLHRLSHAGMRLCTRRIGNGDQSIETYILDVRNLLHAALDVFKLGPLDFDLPQTEPYQPHDSLIKWKAGKMLFAVDHATTVIDAEGAYHNASVIRDPYFDWEETLLVKHRLEAVLQRNIKWDKIVKARNFTCNLLTTYVSQNVEMFRTVLRREDYLSAYRAGHTLSSICNENAAKIEDRILLPCLPHVLVHRKDVDGRAVNQQASAKINGQINTFIRVLSQQYSALYALLNTYVNNDPSSPFHDLPKVIQLDEHHSNPRSIMVFKSAWLVLQMADKLWRDVEKYGKKAWLSEHWLQREKADLKGKLESMSEVAMSAQVDAAVEALRYWEAPTGQKYSDYYDEVVSEDVHQTRDQDAARAGESAMEPVKSTGGRGGHAMEPVEITRQTGGNLAEGSGDAMEMD